MIDTDNENCKELKQKWGNIEKYKSLQGNMRLLSTEQLVRKI